MPHHSGATQGNTQFGQETGGRGKGICVQKPLLWFPQEETGEASDLLNLHSLMLPSHIPLALLHFHFSSTYYLLYNVFINYA